MQFKDITVPADLLIWARETAVSRPTYDGFRLMMIEMLKELTDLSVRELTVQKSSGEFVLNGVHVSLVNVINFDSGIKGDFAVVFEMDAEGKKFTGAMRVSPDTFGPELVLH